MTEFKPVHIMCFYDTEDSRYDLETVLAAKHMRMLLSDLRNEIRQKIKYQEQDHWQEFRDCLNALLEEYDLHKLD